ncbi:carboxypeptidase family protein [Chitinophaga skermanii]|uniref:Carboxypeptidase family protein n=1 Tax=Chitinophaga skermanii TaxID=331697 RepID=A0A327QFE7_9BACT|nr:carboxypeptidase regulatory-like domain-containing protein [Chitinophaga skermanii]RAJ02342.1 carboxypeptidase family protein [Chitinophaga skermanii]
MYLLLVPALLIAQQTVPVNGFVKDSTGRPVVAATVTIITENGAGIAFTKTGSRGEFACQYNGEGVAIKITALGYQPLIVPVTAANGTYELVLRKVEQQLKEVVVKSNTKVSLSSDTLKYRVNAFKENNDRVIADLIARLPGIQVDDKGGISYNGKPITNVYIDGDNLLDGKYRIATNNVPVNAVEQVQVIERDQPVKALNGYVVTNNVSLNLKLTENARTMSIITGFVGAGNKAYHAELNNLVFSRNVKSINNLKTNNIGVNLETENTDIGVSLNNSDIELKKPLPYLSMGDEITPQLPQQYYLMNNDNAGNVNLLFKVKNEWSLRLNAAAMYLKRNYNYNNAFSYYFSKEDTVRYNEIQDNINKLTHFQLQAQVEKNSANIYFKSITKLDLPKWKRNGGTTQNNETFQQFLPTDYLSASNESKIVKALGTDQLISYNSIVQYYTTKENLRILPGVQADIVNDTVAFLQLQQMLHTTNWFINQSGTYKTKFSRIILSASVGVSLEKNALASGLYKTDSASITSQVGTRFRNDLHFQNLGWYGKASIIYLLPKGSIRLEASPTYSFVQYNGALKSAATKNQYFLANPELEFRKNMGRFGELNFRFLQQRTFGQINDIYPGTILVNYRQFNANETPLPTTDISTLGLRYSYRKPISMLFYNLYAGYDYTQQNFMYAYAVDSGATKVVAVDYPNKIHKYTLNGNISKFVFFLNTNLSANINASLTEGKTLFNNELTPFKSYNTNLAITARKKLFTQLTISATGELGSIIQQQRISKDNTIETTTSINKLKTELLHGVSNTISYRLAYNLTSYKQSQQQNVHNSFLDVTLKYAPRKWKSYFEVQCINLLNQQEYRQVKSTVNQLSILELPLRECTIMVKYLFGF